MAVKTITVTEDAYFALKNLKGVNESFSDTILRFSKRRPLSDFFGVLSNETGELLEKAVVELRKRRNEAHRMRMNRIIKEMSGL